MSEPTTELKALTAQEEADLRRWLAQPAGDRPFTIEALEHFPDIIHKALLTLDAERAKVQKATELLKTLDLVCTGPPPFCPRCRIDAFIKEIE